MGVTRQVRVRGKVRIRVRGSPGEACDLAWGDGWGVGAAGGLPEGGGI